MRASKRLVSFILLYYIIIAHVSSNTECLFGRFWHYTTGDETGNQWLSGTAISFRCQFDYFSILSVDVGCVCAHNRIYLYYWNAFGSLFNAFHFLKLFPTHRLCQVTGLTFWVAPPKCCTIGIGFKRAETNCGIGNILGILMKNSYVIEIFLLWIEAKGTVYHYLPYGGWARGNCGRQNLVFLRHLVMHKSYNSMSTKRRSFIELLFFSSLETARSIFT